MKFLSLLWYAISHPIEVARDPFARIFYGVLLLLLLGVIVAINFR